MAYKFLLRDQICFDFVAVVMKWDVCVCVTGLVA
jgi:hypothetical protein